MGSCPKFDSFERSRRKLQGVAPLSTMWTMGTQLCIQYKNAPEPKPRAQKKRDAPTN